MFGVHPTQVGSWKKQALAGLLDVFGNGREQIRQQSDTEKDELYTQIGQLLAAISEPLHIALAPHKFIHLSNRDQHKIHPALAVEYALETYSHVIDSNVRGNKA